MTNEECIKHLQRHRLNCKEGSIEAETLDMAIKALESFLKLEGIINDNFETFFKKAVDALTEHPAKGDSISRSEAIRMFENAEQDSFDVEEVTDGLNYLPSVKPKVGRWIVIDHQRNRFECSNCHTEGYVDTQMYKPIWKYCPICGAKMEVEE